MSRQASHEQRVEVGVMPVEVARRMRGMEGVVFLDTAGNISATSGGAVSILAAEPVAIFRGRIEREEDRLVLDRAMADVGGRMMGWVDYEGGYVFGQYLWWLEYDHVRGEWLDHGGMWSRVEGHPQPADEGVKLGEMEAQVTQAAFMERVERVKAWIAAGDIYQVNLSQAFVGVVEGGSLFGLYEHLREASPAPMAAWLGLAEKEILCSSPELFLKIEGRRIETRPIKGTRPRSADGVEDEANAKELQASEKERAELVMITDLLRNDIGRVCGYGSVRVEELLRLETLAQVHHLVSTVTGELVEGKGMLDALAECFPGGSITGAPKIRAMEIIAELEQTQRGVYCGAIGWLDGSGDGQFNIAIRTMVRTAGVLEYHVGAGIVADSDAQMEYEETLHKAAGIRLAMERWAGASPLGMG